ncbi:DUF2897 family protein [Pseudomonas sp. NW5]|uniref:DUF2897 family protein n=1 Tax=Pseudomonas sp. NW5 TaxID=2934934 RepID=UPI0020226D23|nr:DUF2897 family protein [Pseudomonas sp. NW5]MCL7463213.1 DUF2897 family protein [Pseudomonas sp. NW5]
MPWFAWLLIALAFGMVAGSLLLLRDSADKMPLDQDALERMKARNAEFEKREEKATERDD